VFGFLSPQRSASRVNRALFNSVQCPYMQGSLTVPPISIFKSGRKAVAPIIACAIGALAALAGVLAGSSVALPWGTHQSHEGLAILLASTGVLLETVFGLVSLSLVLLRPAEIKLGSSGLELTVRGSTRSWPWRDVFDPRIDARRGRLIFHPPTALSDDRSIGDIFEIDLNKLLGLVLEAKLLWEPLGLGQSVRLKPSIWPRAVFTVGTMLMIGGIALMLAAEYNP
jgi:hypothetical protein